MFDLTSSLHQSTQQSARSLPFEMDDEPQYADALAPGMVELIDDPNRDELTHTDFRIV